MRTRAMAKARVSKGETRGRATAHKGACVCEGWHEGRRTHDGMRGHARWRDKSSTPVQGNSHDPD